MTEHDKNFIGRVSHPEEFKYSEGTCSWGMSYQDTPNKSMTKNNMIDKDKLLEVLKQELDKAIANRNSVEIAIKKIIIERIENYVEE